MKKSILALPLFIVLTSCLAGNMARHFSFKGKSVSLLENRYGQPLQKELVEGGSRYIWKARDDVHPCTLIILADKGDHVTNVKMVGGNRDCYNYGNPTVKKR